MNELRKLDSSILNLDEISLAKLLSYGDSKFEKNMCRYIKYIFNSVTGEDFVEIVNGLNHQVFLLIAPS